MHGPEARSAAHILVVEDSPTQAEELRYVLEQEGFAVSLARDGAAALESLRKIRPALVISDIVMPRMDGFEFCRRFKSAQGSKGIPVILLTALSDPEDVLRGLECGADGFLTKPYDEKYLLTQVRHILTNVELRQEAHGQSGAEIFFRDRRYLITSDRRQILDLLLSTYETAIVKNRQLKEMQDALADLNRALERKVEERTAALAAEIQQRRLAEEEVRRLNVDLENRVRLRTAELEAVNSDLESFSYTVSHDLKTPLRAVLGFSQILARRHASQLDADCSRLLGHVIEGAQKMDRLIDDILAFTRAGRGTPERKEIDMDALVRSLVADPAFAVQDRDVRILVGELPPAIGDPAAVRQIVGNLLGNALKFTRPRAQAVIEIGGESRGAESEYFVRDNGVGFDDRYAERLFGVLKRLHSSRDFEGTGIGLAIVKRFVEKLGGRVRAEGTVNVGATFHFTLPAGGRPPSEPNPCSKVCPPLDGGRAPSQ